MDEKIENVACNSCDVICEYKDRNGEIPPSVLQYSLAPTLSLSAGGVRYHIVMSKNGGEKIIHIESDSDIELLTMLSVLNDAFRFNNLFEGCFYHYTSCVTKGEEYIYKLRPLLLSYFESIERYAQIGIYLSDNESQRVCCNLVKYLDETEIIHPVFLYSTFTNGMAVDLRMALLLEVFEPLSEKLVNSSIVQIPEVQRSYSSTCPHCNKPISRTVKQKPTLAEKLRAIIDKFGQTIFQGEDIDIIISKAVKTRNRIDHVIVDEKMKRKVFSGPECGFYLHKFSLLYRYLILSGLGVDQKDLDAAVHAATKSLNGQFPQCRIIHSGA